MKLSHIRSLSWGISLTGAALCSTGAYKTFEAGISLTPLSLQAWSPPEPDYTELEKKSHLSENEIKNALAVIMKRKPLPQPPSNPSETGPVTPPPPDPPKPLNMLVQLIAWDDSELARHMVFIEYTQLPKMSAPYFEGELIFGGPDRLRLIERERVAVERKDGSLIWLSPQKPEIVGSVSDLEPVLRIEVPPEHETTLNPPPPPVENGVDKYVQRTVPTDRKVTRDENYGIDIIQYDTNDDRIKRFAISESDRIKLEKDKYRLMADINPELAYDANGVVIGIKVMFLTDSPLLGKFGIQQADILTHIDDIQVTSADQVLKIHESIQTTQRRVRLKFLRNASPFNVIFEMDDFPNIEGPKTQ